MAKDSSKLTVSVAAEPVPATPEAGTPEPSAPAPAAIEAASKAPVLRTPAQWGAALSLKKPRDQRLPQSVDVYDWRHAAADATYGWSLHAYHYQSKPFEISEAVYLEALKQQETHPASKLVDAAIPPSQQERLKSFKPGELHKSKCGGGEANKEKG